MKELVNFCRQQQRFGDSYGECVVLLEDNETIDDVKKQYIKEENYFGDTIYSNPREIEKYDDGKTLHEGRLIILDTYRMYLD